MGIGTLKPSVSKYDEYARQEQRLSHPVVDVTQPASFVSTIIGP